MDFNELKKNIYEKLHRRSAGIDKLDRLWEAAVLVPIVETAQGPSLLFQVRSLRLNRQPGEVCFPGGKYECADKKFDVTAVRETCEELGLAADDIELLGEMDCLVTHMGPIIHPFVGVIKNPGKIIFSQDEVEEVFTVPIKALVDQEPQKAAMQLADRPTEQFPFDLVPGKKKDWRFHKEYTVYFYKYEKYIIWGLTARILYAFLRRNKENFARIDK